MRISGNYEAAHAAVDALEARGWRLGLDRMAAFCKAAGLDRFLGGEGKPRFIHIAGTNGKGSTAAFVESILRHNGYRTGAFYSPYVQEYRERFQSNGHLITKARYADLVERLLQVAGHEFEKNYGGVTKFELEAALGFLFWGEEGLDWVALEVGLGGRLDATNVVVPSSTVVVSIGLDHVAVLGDSLEKIASEKAGILKKGVPVVVGDMDSLPRSVIGSRAQELGCPLWRFGEEILLDQGKAGWEVRTPVARYDGLKLGLLGEMQPHNVSLALAALDACNVSLDLEKVRIGVALAWIPGRFQELHHGSVSYVVDGAHNAAAAHMLIRTLHIRFAHRRPWVLVSNTLGGHDPEAFYSELQGYFADAIIVPIYAPRALPVEEAARIASRYIDTAHPQDSLEAGLAEAEQKAGHDGLVLVTGSNYLAGEVLNALAPTRI